jgi:cell division protease FtsH
MSNEQKGKPVKGNKKGSPKKNFNFPFGGSPNPGPGNNPFGNWQWRFSLVYIVVLLIMMSLFNYVFMTNVNPTIDFSEFKAKIASGEIKRVELDANYYTGYTTEEKQS